MIIYNAVSLVNRWKFLKSEVLEQNRLLNLRPYRKCRRSNKASSASYEGYKAKLVGLENGSAQKEL